MDTQLKADRKELIDSLGGEAAVAAMDHEARADALEDHLSTKLDAAITAKNGKTYPTVAEIADAVDKRGFRRGVGRLFLHDYNMRILQEDTSGRTVPKLAPMPERPTLVDFFERRFAPATHLLQSARLAKRNSGDARTAGQSLCRTTGARRFEPYPRAGDLAIRYRRCGLIRHHPGYYQLFTTRCRTSRQLTNTPAITNGTWTRGW
jgi:hypothetical protein